MVLLSAMPCNDESELRNELVVTVAHLASDDHDGCTETCSPICACACCGQNVVQNNFVQLQNIIPTTAISKVLTFKSLSLKQRANNIWQPPKLV